MRRARVFGLALAVEACRPSTPRSEVPPSSAPAEGGSVVPDASTERARISAEPTGAGIFGWTLDRDRRSCERDAECQILGSCECDVCIPSRVMHVALCPNVCANDPCGQRHARCDHGLCTTEGHGDSLVTALQKFGPAVNAVGQVALDAPEIARLFATSRSWAVAWEPGVAQHPTWNLHGRPLAFVSGIPIRGAFVETAQLWIEGDAATIDWVFYPRGSRAHVELRRSGGSWSRTSVTIE